MLEIRTDYIAVDVSLPDAEAVITLLAEKLHEQGAVGPDYGAATLAREQRHPTGLPTKPFCIALPHADADGVYWPALAVASLQKPVVFRNMADPDEEVSVELVLLLANNNPEEQVKALRNLALVFGQPDKLVELRSLSSPSEIVEWLKREITSN